MRIRFYPQEKRCVEIYLVVFELDHLTTKKPIHAVGDSPREACLHHSNQDSEREAVKSFITKTELAELDVMGVSTGRGTAQGPTRNYRVRQRTLRGRF